MLIPDHCRICSAEFISPSIVSYDGMPQSAQYLPTEETKSIDKGIYLEVVQCSGCGVIQTTNEPVPYFREVIRASAVSKEMTTYRQGQFQQFVDQFQLHNKKIIEIGSGRGEYLQILEKCGVDCYGIEYGFDSTLSAQNAGLNVTRMFLEKGDEVIPHGPFDGFLFLNFLEHLPDPCSVLNGIQKNIKQESVGIVEVPNFDMILENSLFTEFVADHLFYFSKDTLMTTLKRNGFDILKCEESWHRYTITAVVKKRKPINFRNADILRKRMLDEFDKFLNQYPKQQVAMWGAGHQAFAVMSLANLGGKIRYVVDSAPFKQGYLTPTTHIPIVAPEHFFSDPTSAIIVIAGSYTTEVVEIIREKCSSAVDIAYLQDNDLKRLPSPT